MVEEYIGTALGNPAYNAIWDFKNWTRFKVEWKRAIDGYRLRFEDNDGRWFSAVEFDGTYGSENDLIEIFTDKLSREEKDPIGWLTCGDAFEYFMKWVKHQD